MAKNKLFRKSLEYFNLGVYHPFPRSAIRFIKENNTRTGLVGVEIGVYKGDNAKSIMKTLPMKKLFLVDPYEIYEDYIDEKSHQNFLNKAERFAKGRLSKYGNRVEFIKKKSLDALADILNSLDFVYIDGNHEYEFVKRDMEAYFEKLRSGGILAGHDIQNGLCREHDGVTRAFVEFANEKNLFPYIFIPDWWVIKK